MGGLSEVPSVVPKLIKWGARLHMQTGAGEAITFTDAAYAVGVSMTEAVRGLGAPAAAA